MHTDDEYFRSGGIKVV